MEITEHKNLFETTYNIKIFPEDNLESWEIAECFKHQYPKTKCVISTAKTYIKCELIFVGLNLG